MATFRVKFTLTKLQKTLRKTELRQITQPQKITSKKIYIIKTKLFILQTHIGQANRKPKAKQMHSKLKTLGCRLTAHFRKFRKTSTFSLKDERVLSSISHPSSRISQLKKKKTKVMSHPNNNPQPTSH